MIVYVIMIQFNRELVWEAGAFSDAELGHQYLINNPPLNEIADVVPLKVKELR